MEYFLVYPNSINMEKSTANLEWEKVMSCLMCDVHESGALFVNYSCAKPSLLFRKVNRGCWNTELFPPSSS